MIVQDADNPAATRPGRNEPTRSGEDAGRLVAWRRTRDGPERGILAQASIRRGRTARLEPASLWHVDRVRRLPLEDLRRGPLS